MGLFLKVLQAQLGSCSVHRRLWGLPGVSPSGGFPFHSFIFLFSVVGIGHNFWHRMHKDFNEIMAIKGLENPGPSPTFTHCYPHIGRQQSSSTGKERNHQGHRPSGSQEFTTVVLSPEAGDSSLQAEALGHCLAGCGTPKAASQQRASMTHSKAGCSGANLPQSLSFPLIK